MNYYLTVKKKKKNEVMIHATKWLSLNNIMPSERSQS